MKPKILYVEDDTSLNFVTRDNLELKGYEIVSCEDGKTALQEFRASRFDLCILDVMLPEMDGFALAKEIRKIDEQIPLIFLSARTMKEDRIHGLSIGGDDYIVKPFSIEELILKVEVFLKRNRINPANSNDKKVFALGNCTFDAKKHQLEIDGETISLTSKEADLLLLFCKNEGKILKREEILTAIWGSDDFYLSRSLDVFVSRIRKLLKKTGKVNLRTIHGTGFILESDDQNL